MVRRRPPGRKRKCAALIAAGALLAGPACPRPGPAGHAARGASHWAYSGRAGPRRWAALGPELVTCGRGRAQSPVDLAGAAKGRAGGGMLRYRPAPVTAVDTGHTIEWDFGPGSSIVLEGVRYALLQVHFHAPAEHLLSGARQAIELHFVHRAPDGRMAVVAAVGRPGRPNPEVARLLQAGPGSGATGLSVSPEGLVPGRRSAVRYEGSLTTPPCSEGVRWVVLTDPVELSSEQLGWLRARYSGNYRPAQPLNGRRLTAVPDAFAEWPGPGG